MNFLRMAIHSGDLARAFGGSGRDGSRRDLAALLRDCEDCVERRTDARMTLAHVRYRFDLDDRKTRTVLLELGVPHDDSYVCARRLRDALADLAIIEGRG